MVVKNQDFVLLPKVNFIQDKAADEDRFGSHTRVARAIASVVTTHKNLKVIGLIGAWGSGKSTILRFVQDALKKESSIDVYCFLFDAWRHQNDPPRRSFLETLVHFFVAEKLANPEKKATWQSRLDKLSGRVEEWEKTVTPTLTTSGRLLVWSLFFLPIGAPFVNHEWYSKAFAPTSSLIEYWAFPVGVLLLALPLLLALGTYIYWRPAIWPWKCAFWSTHRGKHSDESIISLVMNRQQEKALHRITRTPDPTAIEFQDMFRRIMRDVAREDRRFIFVIDNLDRLPETDAVAIWGTIRSFFLGAQETDSICKNTVEPLVILPIDEGAIRRMYHATHGEDADALAKSFMDKTFDLVFRVTPPVLSDWGAYLEGQLRSVFGDSMEAEWPYITCTLYEQFIFQARKHQTNTAAENAVTPRSINTLVNSIATLWLQWSGVGIHYASVAYYAIFRDDIDKDIFAAASSSRAPQIAEFDTKWQQNIAALHYGVPPENALQILIEQPLREAITNKMNRRSEH